MRKHRGSVQVEPFSGSVSQSAEERGSKPRSCGFESLLSHCLFAGQQVRAILRYMPMATPAAQSAYQLEWRRKRRDAWFAENGPCVDCRSWEQLELDHIDPTLKVDHKIWSWARARREAELAKCVARCQPCHAKKSGTEAARGERHGRSTISDEVIRELRRRVAAGESQSSVARSLGLTRMYVWQVVNHRVRVSTT